MNKPRRFRVLMFLFFNSGHTNVGAFGPSSCPPPNTARDKAPAPSRNTGIQGSGLHLQRSTHIIFMLMLRQWKLHLLNLAYDKDINYSTSLHVVLEILASIIRPGKEIRFKVQKEEIRLFLFIQHDCVRRKSKSSYTFLELIRV